MNFIKAPAAPYCDCLVAIGSHFEQWLQNDGRQRKCFVVTCQATHELPSGATAIGLAQRLTTRPVEARVCMHPTDPSTDRRFLCARITEKRFGQFSVIQTLLEKSFWDGLGGNFVQN